MSSMSTAPPSAAGSRAHFFAVPARHAGHTAGLCERPALRGGRATPVQRAGTGERGRARARLSPRRGISPASSASTWASPQRLPPRRQPLRTTRRRRGASAGDLMSQRPCAGLLFCMPTSRHCCAAAWNSPDLFGQRSDDLDLRRTLAFTPACRRLSTLPSTAERQAGDRLAQRPGPRQGLTPRHLGQTIERHEDAALLTGRGRFADDLGEAPGTLQAAVLRSPHAHAELRSTPLPLAMPGVRAVLTGEDVKRWSQPFVVGVKARCSTGRWRSGPCALQRRTRRGGDCRRPLPGGGRARCHPRRVPPSGATVDIAQAQRGRRTRAARGRRQQRGQRAPLQLWRSGAGLRGRRGAWHSPCTTCATAARRWSAASWWPSTRPRPTADMPEVLSNFMGPFSLHR